jgi:hypothetical protein
MVANYARRVIGRAAEMDRLALEQSSVSPQKMNQALNTIEKKAASQPTER